MFKPTLKPQIPSSQPSKPTRVPLHQFPKQEPIGKTFSNCLSKEKKPCLNKSNNSSTKTLPIKHGTPTSSNTSLLNGVVGKKKEGQVIGSRSIGGTPDTFKYRRKAQDFQLPNHEPTKFSFKKNGRVKAYAANTNQGIVRNYNEDRVSIILNIMKPLDRQDEFWPRCSFFGVYDGHGGVQCADFLRDNLHQFVISHKSFPFAPKEALLGGFIEAERVFLASATKLTSIGETEIIEKSGSCAIVILIVGDMCYIANVGDSRAVMSGEAGDKIWALSRDHKPMDEIEYRRIAEAGGKVYQTKVQAYCNKEAGGVGVLPAENAYLVGPYRVLPGRLSVTRTFGDVEAKLVNLGGNPGVVIAVPDIKCFQIGEEHDFIVMASDGIFDKLSNPELIEAVWSCAREFKGENIHQTCANGVELIMKSAIAKRTVDNITVVMIAFSSFKYLLFPKRPDLIGHNSLDQITDYSKIQQISHINNSFDLGTKEFSLELKLLGQKNTENKLIKNEKGCLIRKKTTTTNSISSNQRILAPNKGSNEVGQEKVCRLEKPFKKPEANNLYSHRTVYKNVKK